MVLPTSTGSLIPFLLVVALAVHAVQALAEGKTPKALYDEAVDDQRIVWGKPTTAKDFPHQLYVSIQRETSSVFCGGSIISLSWSMSAAHCFAGEKLNDTEGFIITAKKISLYAGVTDRSAVNSDPDVQSNILDESDFKNHLFIHPEYRIGGRFNNDIALIKLKEPWTPTEKVSPIGLADQYDFIVGKKLNVSGWGKIYGTSVIA